MNEILANCKLLTVGERAKWTRLKNVVCYMNSKIPEIKNFFKFSENTRTSRLIPLLLKQSYQSETLRKSVRFKCIAVWNDLPKDWIIHGTMDLLIPIGKFKKKCYDWLVESRKSIWLNFAK